MTCLKRCRRRRAFSALMFVMAVLIGYNVFMIPYNKVAPKGSDLHTGSHSIFKLDEQSNRWPFNLSRTVKCPDVKFTDSPLHRRKMFLYCDEYENAELRTTYTVNPSDVDVLDHDNTCLGSFIQTHCYDHKPVPNIVHYVWYADRKVTVFNFVSLMSVVRFMKPCLVVFHGPFIPRGKLWNYFIRMYPNVISVNSTLNMEVYGQRLRFREHASDVMRIEILQKYGGLYIDWDEVLVKPVDILRNHPFTMGLENINKLGNQFIMAEPDATFLAHWHHGYKNYSEEWSYNSIVYPYELAQKNPEDIHIERFTLLKPRQPSGFALWYANSNWAANYALHFYLRGYKESKGISVDDIRTLNTTIGAVCRYILYGRKEICRIT